MAEKTEGIKILSENRKARFNYTIEGHLECGLELKGTEVKSIKTGQFAYPDCYADILKNELFLIGMQITPYDFGNINNHDPMRKKKLLLHKAELNKLRRKVEERGYTLVPLSFYLKNGKIKVRLGICCGKKLHDKRDALKDKDQKRAVDRELRYN